MNDAMIPPHDDDDSRYAPPIPPPALLETDALEEDSVEEALPAPVPPRLRNEIPLIDVDSALAAVSDLDVMLAEQEEEERREQVRVWLAEREQARLIEVTRVPLVTPDLLTLARGNIASVVPGLALIGIGAWLTFAFTTDTAPALPVMAAIIGGALGLTLLVAWLAGGRWNRGLLLLLAWGGFSAGSVFLPVPIGWGITGALGVAVLLTGLLGRPFSPRLMGAGGVIGLIAALGIVYGLGYIPPVVLTALALPLVWIPITVVAGLILLLPLMARLWR